MTVRTYFERAVMPDLFGNQKPKAPKDLLAVFDAAHRECFDGIPAPIVGKKDGPLAARLLKRYEFDQLSTWARLYFVTPDPFIQQSGYTFGVFSACLGKVIQFERRRNVRHAAVAESPEVAKRLGASRYRR